MYVRIHVFMCFSMKLLSKFYSSSLCFLIRLLSVVHSFHCDLTASLNSSCSEAAKLLWQILETQEMLAKPEAGREWQRQTLRHGLSAATVEIQLCCSLP